MYWDHFKGVYIVVGMMIIGAALSGLDRLVISPRFIMLAFAGKFLMMPLMAFSLVSLDRAVTHFYTPEIHALFMVLAIVPFAANITAFASQLDVEPEKAATTVLAGTVLALFYIPFVLGILG